jgi:hypothetical protein
MRNISERFVATNVMIRFEDGSESFHVPPGSTVADISEYLDKISRRHGGRPLSIDIRFKALKPSTVEALHSDRAPMQ